MASVLRRVEQGRDLDAREPQRTGLAQLDALVTLLCQSAIGQLDVSDPDLGFATAALAAAARDKLAAALVHELEAA